MLFGYDCHLQNSRLRFQFAFHEDMAEVDTACEVVARTRFAVPFYLNYPRLSD